LRSQAAAHPELAEDIRTEANYFAAHKERMRYPTFRKQGVFVGPGVIEVWVLTAKLRICMSSMKRCRREVMESSFAK
jgi:hypothetical protein